MNLSPKRTAILALTAVFAVGLAGGILLEDVVDDVPWPFASHEHDRDKADDPADDDAEEAFFDSLGLPAERRAAIERALDAREHRLEQYWEGKVPELRALVDSSRAEIRLLLTPEQQASYNRWITGRSGTRVPSQ